MLTTTRRGVRLAIAWVAMAVPFLAGAECSPTSPACSVDDDANGVLSCPAGESAVCINRCVPLGQSGDECDLDPCLTPHLCRNGLSCQADTGTCQETAAGPLQACDPTLTPAAAEESCSSGTFCRAFSCDESDRPPAWLHESAEGMCFVPQREGESCDANWLDLFDEGSAGSFCRPCEPGTQCQPHPEHGNPVCLRPCSDESDCPCERPTCESGVCEVECRESQTSCSDDGLGCCDPEASCLDVVVPTLGAMSVSRSFCCRPTGASCESASECCPNAVCNSGQCELCGSYPGAAPTASGCCGDLVPRMTDEGLVCGLPCPLAMSNTICRTWDGTCGSEQHWICDPVQGDVCPVDSADPDEGSPCVDEYWTSECGFSVRGTLVCDGELTCDENEDEFCITGGGPCGQMGVPDCPSNIFEFGCMNNSDCVPGSFCVRSMNGTAVIGSYCRACSVPNLPPACWRPGQNPGCDVYPPGVTCGS